MNEKYNLANDNTNLMFLRRFPGIDGQLGNKLDLENDFVVKIITATGNYAEIYNRHLGPKSNVEIPRGLNELYINKGLMIAPPIK